MTAIRVLRAMMVLFPPVIGFLAGQVLQYGLLVEGYFMLALALVMAFAAWHDFEFLSGSRDER